MLRKCKYPGCKTPLNKYNPGPCCMLHQPLFDDMIETKIEDAKREICEHKNYIKEAGKIQKHKRGILLCAQKIKNLRNLKRRNYYRVVDQGSHREDGEE